jgi:hypothetical protein
MRLLLLGLAAACNVAAQTSLAVLDRGSVYEMSRIGNYWAARIYVTPANGVTNIQTTIRGVTAGTRSDPAFLNAFGPIQSYPAAGPVQAFDIATKEGSDLAKGTYDFVLQLAAGGKTETKAIQLTIPAAVIVTQPLVISRSIGWFLFPAESDSLPALSVRETANRSFARIAIQQSDKATDAEGTHSGTLIFDPSKASKDVTGDRKNFLVERNRPVDFPYSIQGEFPVGSAKLNLGLYSDQLDAAVNVPVEVRTHVTRAALWWWVVFGLVLGFLTRGVLKQRVELGQSKRQALDEAGRLRSERDAVPDNEFRTRIDRAERALLDKIQKAEAGSRDGLTKAVTDAEAALTGAVNSLNTRTTEQEAELKKAQDFLQTSWILPNDFASALDAMRTAAQRAGDLLENRDVVRSKAALTAAQKSLREFMIASVTRWKDQAKTVADVFASVGKLTEDNGLFAEKLADFQKAAGTISRLEPSASLDNIGKVLDSVHETIQLALSLAAYLKTAVPAAFERMSGEFHHPLLPDRPAWKNARSHTSRLSASLPEDVDDLESLQTGFSKMAEALRDDWRRALVAERASKDVLKLFDQGKFVEAAHAGAQKRIEVLKKASQSLLRIEESGMVPELMGGNEEQLDAIKPEEDHWFPVAGRKVLRRESFERTAPRVDLPEQLHALTTRTLGDLYRAQLGIGVLSLIGLAVVGYYLFADKWSGTSTDMLKAFFWGFTSDIGLDALITAGKSKFGAAG